jgi:hypothetical protein
MYRELVSRDVSKTGILLVDFLNVIETYLQISGIVILLQHEYASRKSESISMPGTI